MTVWAHTDFDLMLQEYSRLPHMAQQNYRIWTAVHKAVLSSDEYNRDSDCAWFSRSLLPLCCSSPRTFYHATTSCRIRSGLKCKKPPAVAKLSSLFGHIRAYKRCWGMSSVQIPAQSRLVWVSVMYVWTKLWSLMMRPVDPVARKRRQPSHTASSGWAALVPTSSGMRFMMFMKRWGIHLTIFDPFNSRLHCLCLI